MILQLQSGILDIPVNEDIEMLANIIQDDEKMYEVIAAFSGCNIYVPSTLSRVFRQEQMRDDFNNLLKNSQMSKNRAYSLLGARYGLTSRRVRDIINHK